MSTPLATTLYFLLVTGVAALFVLVNLTLGKLLRPDNPSAEKGETYECGEPTIGTSFVQFDLRFYVIALLFIVFDVEVAFLFPWATVFGKATQLSVADAAGGDSVAWRVGRLEELGIPPAQALTAAADPALAQASRQLSLLSVADILAFFAILMVGFAYLWRRGDLDWVRATRRPARRPVRRVRLAGERGGAAALSTSPARAIP